ncbi:LysR family transcriptional regulator [Methylopila sp. Yamaguchi]|uniref:LysR family transcriptional regulator n=1 Tax=Methylopila sp. Yamaguchi TaxID=1437817 RepID=UPI000CBE5857|nr:LysR family transcriptional regulator [Methylopila sp. Yamaguchi]GBD46937.1 LysR family transcriptional regulator [Methylopila sp. Yamaguchi]
MFEFTHLRCFVAVAEELHFGRAARRLNMTQPPLSRQIQLLEHLLEAKLFERSNRRVALTPSGRAFLPEARRLLQLAEGAAMSIRRIGVGEAGTVTIGFTAASGYDFLPRIVRELRAELATVDLVLREAVTSAQLDALASGRLDIALVRPPVRRASFRSRIVLREPMILALPAGHPMAARDVIDLHDLGDEPVISYSPFEARYFHDLVLSLFGAAGVQPTITQHVSQIHSVLALVRIGLGLALVPEAAAKLRFDGVVHRPIRSPGEGMAQLAAVWRTDQENPAAERALEVILRQAPPLDS